MKINSARAWFKGAYHDLRYEIRQMPEEDKGYFFFCGEALAERWSSGRDEWHVYSREQRAAGSAYLKYRSYGGVDYFWIRRMRRIGLGHVIAGEGSRYFFPPYNEPKPKLP